jgi:hypothetical protein
MFTGKRFKLRTATVAVNAERVALTIPAEQIVEVISGPSDSDQTVNVLWNGHAVVMFDIDLRNRGEELANSSVHGQQGEPRDRERILEALSDDLRAAQQRRDEASARFAEIIKDVPSGIPHPDGTARIHQASQKYSLAQKEAMEALVRLNNFLVHGTIPYEIGRKSVREETPKLPGKKAGQA